MSQPYMRRPPELKSELPARSQCYFMWQSQHVLSIGMIDIIHEVPVYMQGDGRRALCKSPLLFVEKVEDKDYTSYPRRASRCFRIARFESIHRSTQFCAHVSSFCSRRPDEIFPAIHFFQQISDNEWTARS